jgi:hypothetical protein
VGEVGEIKKEREVDAADLGGQPYRQKIVTVFRWKKI